MKFFTNKKAMTLVELVISVMIWIIVLVIIFNFIADAIKNLQSSRERVWVYNDIFSLRENIDKQTKWWFFISTWIIDENTGSWYDVLLLENKLKTKWYIYWVVDVDTMKLDPKSDYNIYKNKVIWYRSLSKTEINDIEWDSDKVYDLIFFNDKLYNSLLTKDFQLDYYNSGAILDMNLSVWTSFNPLSTGRKIDQIIKKDDLIKFNLDF